MSPWITISYIGYLAMLVVQYVLLRRVLRQASWLKALIGPSNGPRRNRPLRGLPVGTSVPGFRASILNADRKFNSDELKGLPSLLIFVSKATVEMEPSKTDSLRLFIRVFGKRLRGRIYCVCSAPTRTCSILRDMLTNRGDSEPASSEVVMLEDSYGSIARAFAVQRTPTAVRIDEQGRIEQYGFPLDLVLEELPPSEARELELFRLSE